MTPGSRAARTARLASALALAAGTAAAGGQGVRALDFVDLDGWASDDHAAARRVFARTCAAAGPGALGLTRDDWAPVCAAASEAGDARAFFETHFLPVELASTDPSLVTGYYEPELDGARSRGGRFLHPIHRMPEDDATRFTRAEIRAGALDGRGLELLWLDDPVAAFFLHVQGSGRVRLAEGGTVRLGYAGRNAHPYRSIGAALRDEGLLSGDDLTAQGIRDWLSADPSRLDWLDRNPSYIFFREVEGLDGADGPVGAMGAPLTPMRSIAVDPALTPLGAPVWLETETPEGSFRALSVAQDTGAAIKGARRADLFFGTGEAALAQAGRMAAPGRMAVLVPRAAAARLAGE